MRSQKLQRTAQINSRLYSLHGKRARMATELSAFLPPHILPGRHCTPGRKGSEDAGHACKPRCTRQGWHCSTTQGKLWGRRSCMQTQVCLPGHILQLNWRKATSTQFMYANSGAPARADAAAQRKASCEYAIYVCKHKFTRLGTFCC